MDDLTIKANAEKERLMGSADDMEKVMNSNEFPCCVPVPYDGGVVFGNSKCWTGSCMEVHPWTLSLFLF